MLPMLFILNFISKWLKMPWKQHNPKQLLYPTPLHMFFYHEYFSHCKNLVINPSLSHHSN